jgi:hypothetical protein
MRTLILLLLLTGPALAQRPTVIELYTSQGCSSCPPADALLTELSRTDPTLLPLDLHVTYWDRLGWKDPYSLDAATRRQQQFSQRLGLDTVYTPQLVIDGRYEAIGSDRAAVQQAIQKARVTAATVPLTVTATPTGLHVHAAASPAGGSRHGTLLLAGFDRLHATPVHHGENSGRTLTEVNVVRALSPAAAWSGTAIDLDVPRPEGERVALLLQADDGSIIGAAATP